MGPPNNKGGVIAPPQYLLKQVPVLPALGAQILYREQAGRVQFRIYLTLELASSAVLGLHIDHTETVIDGHAATGVLGQVMIRVCLTDVPGLPGFALAVIYNSPRQRKGLGVHVMYTLADRVVGINRR